MSDRIFTDFGDRQRSLWGKHWLKLNHTLPSSPLFTDEALAGLIEAMPRSNYNLIQMGAQNEPRRYWREGEVGTTRGAEVIEAIRTGRMWINLRRVMDVDPRYAALLEQMFDEIEDATGEKTFRHNLGILISSPGAQVYYHADIPGQALWQVRGQKRIYIYPAEEPFMAPESVEGMILGETEEDIPYQSWFDDHAAVFDLEPGDMLHWPLNGPHRVTNHDVLNVSVTTEHYTDAIRRSYAMNFANGVLRRRFGMQHLSRRTEGPAFWAKAGLAMAWRKAGLQKSRRIQRVVDFRIADPQAGSIEDIPSYAI